MKHAPEGVDTPLIYLNNAATTWPKPPEVLEEVAACLRMPVHEAGRTTGDGSTDYPSATREALAAFFHAEKPEHFIFTQNATDALNLLIHGFVKKTGAPFHAITTELDHNSVLRPLTTLEQERTITLSVVPFSDDRVTLAAIKKAIRPETRLVVMTHGSNVLGSVQDIRPDCGILCVQMIFSSSLTGPRPPGTFPSTLRISLRVPSSSPGTRPSSASPASGGSIIRDPDAVAITRQGGTGTDSQNLAHPLDDAAAVRGRDAQLSGDCIALCRDPVHQTDGSGCDREEREWNLPDAFIRELKRIPGITLYNDAPDLPVVSFNIQGIDNHEAGFILARAYNIITRTGLHCAPLVHERIDGGKGCIRASFSYFNTREQVETAAAAIREVAESAGS